MYIALTDPSEKDSFDDLLTVLGQPYRLYDTVREAVASRMNVLTESLEGIAVYECLTHGDAIYGIVYREVEPVRRLLEQEVRAQCNGIVEVGNSIVHFVNGDLDSGTLGEIPALIERHPAFGNVTVRYMKRWKMHRDGDRPAVVTIDLSSGQIVREEFWIDGQLHRGDGLPASFTTYGENRYERYEYGIKLSVPYIDLDYAPRLDPGRTCEGHHIIYVVISPMARVDGGSGDGYVVGFDTIAEAVLATGNPGSQMVMKYVYEMVSPVMPSYGILYPRRALILKRRIPLKETQQACTGKIKFWNRIYQLTGGHVLSMMEENDGHLNIIEVRNGLTTREVIHFV